MVQASQPETKDTAPPEFVKMAVEWLEEQAELDKDFAALLDARPCTSCAALEQPCRCPIADEWVEALASELEAAVSDRQGEFMAALKEGPDTSDVAEMLAEMRRIHADLIPVEDAAEAAASQERWR